MIAELKPYPEYKDSGQPWLGKCPSHWSQRRMKFLFAERVQKGFPNEPLLAATQTKGVVRKTDYEERTVTASKDFHLLKLVESGDYVISLRSFQGGIEIAHCRGIISPAYTVLVPKPESRSGYFSHFFKSPDFISSLTLFVTGIREGQNVDYVRLSRAYLPLPPVNEQDAIMRFLNHANHRMERYLRNKTRQLALVTELLLNTTQRTLASPGTRTVRLSIAAEMISRPIERHPYKSYTPIGLYNRGRGIFHKPTRNGSELGDSEFFWIEDGDIVLSGQFAWEGAVALARKKDSGCVASHRYPILRGREEYATSAMLIAFLRTPFGALLLDQHSRGAAGENGPLNVRTLMKEKIPIPALPDQARVAALLDYEYSVAQALARIVRVVSEYRARLVADVVTGKRDVRDVARHLISEPEQSGPDNGEIELAEQINTELATSPELQ